jgi:Spy/CpxP family protein refolding chaperone
VSIIMQTEESRGQMSVAPRPSRRRLWLLVVPVLGSLAAGGFATSSARAETAAADAGDAAGPGFMARRLERMLDKVNATASQRSQIRAIWSGLRPQLRSAHQQHAAIRAQIVTALTAPTINASDVEKLRQQSMSWADKTSSLFTQGIVATAQVLTPDQRKIAAQEFEQHHGHRFGQGPPFGAGAP